MFSNKLTKKKPLNFVCKNCDFITCNKKDYSRHLQTKKHKINENQCILPQKTPYDCSCGKSYKDHSGLWRHKKKCLIEKEEKEETVIDVELNDKNLILTLIQQNTELQKQMIDVIKNGINVSNTINNNNTNSNNKTFNLHLFLNETCKDAMNIMDFVDSIKFQLSDLESIGELGYINGLSKVIIRNLKALDENMRPVHCSDLRREKIYVKDADTWTKEGADNKILKDAIKYIAHKNVKMIPAFREKYPDCIYSDSRKSDQYNRLIIEAMGGDGNDEDGKANKIISKIAKEVLIEK
jgi:hypothetical protein